MSRRTAIIVGAVLVTVVAIGGLYRSQNRSNGTSSSFSLLDTDEAKKWGTTEMQVLTVLDRFMSMVNRDQLKDAAEIIHPSEREEYVTAEGLPFTYYIAVADQLGRDGHMVKIVPQDVRFESVNGQRVASVQILMSIQNSDQTITGTSPFHLVSYGGQWMIYFLEQSVPNPEALPIDRVVYDPKQTAQAAGNTEGEERAVLEVALSALSAIRASDIDKLMTMAVPGVALPRDSVAQLSQNGAISAMSAEDLRMLSPTEAKVVYRIAYRGGDQAHAELTLAKLGDRWGIKSVR